MRKFSSMDELEVVKVLFDANLHSEIISKVLEISPTSVTKLRKKVVATFGEIPQKKHNKTGVYREMLGIYKRLSKRRISSLNPGEKLLYQASIIMLDVPRLETVIKGIVLFSRSLVAPKIKRPIKPEFEGYVNFLEEVSGIYILDPTENRVYLSNALRLIQVDHEQIDSEKELVRAIANSMASELERDKISDLEIQEESLIEATEELLSTLTERETSVLRLCYGLGETKITLDEIGVKFDLTRERTRQIKEKALRRAKDPKRSEILLALTKSRLALQLFQKKTAEQAKKNEVVIPDGQGDLLISDLGLSIRAQKCLNLIEIRTIGELLIRSKSDLKKFRNVGTKTLREVEEGLRKRGLKLLD